VKLSIASDLIVTIVIPPANTAVTRRKAMITALRRTTTISLSAIVAFSIRSPSWLIGHSLRR
jgi:hypothetical protein